MDSLEVTVFWTDDGQHNSRSWDWHCRILRWHCVLQWDLGRTHLPCQRNIPASQMEQFEREGCKMSICMKECMYLGHIVRNEQVKPDSSCRVIHIVPNDKETCARIPGTYLSHSWNRMLTDWQTNTLLLPSRACTDG